MNAFIGLLIYPHIIYNVCKNNEFENENDIKIINQDHFKNLYFTNCTYSLDLSSFSKI